MRVPGKEIIIIGRTGIILLIMIPSNKHFAIKRTKYLDWQLLNDIQEGCHK